MSNLETTASDRVPRGSRWLRVVGGSVIVLAGVVTGAGTAAATPGPAPKAAHARPATAGGATSCSTLMAEMTSVQNAMYPYLIDEELADNTITNDSNQVAGLQQEISSMQTEAQGFELAGEDIAAAALLATAAGLQTIVNQLQTVISQDQQAVVVYRAILAEQTQLYDIYWNEYESQCTFW